MLGLTFAAAGAVAGAAQGLVKVTGKEMLGLVHTSPAPGRPAYHHLHKPLINLVVVGDQGCGKAALVQAFAGGRQQEVAAAASTSTQSRADFQLLQCVVDEQQPVSLCLWNVRSREEARDLGSVFYSLASAFLVVYSPGQQHPAEALEHWAAQCGGGAAAGAPPLVVVASCRPDGDDAEQEAAVAEAEEWCQRRGGLPHFIVRGLEDLHTIHAAFLEALRLALRGHSELSPMQSELIPALHRLDGQPALVRQAT